MMLLDVYKRQAIMIEHFRNQTKNQIGGKAKAMVVTASRLHAVRYLFEFRKYIKAKGYNDLDVLVAFSGEIEDDDQKWTEEKLNKNKDGETIKESQLKEYFHTDDFNMLIVAEKYQTGFDEPYLHTMFVDKKLTGIKAVQTLSRLNRTMPGKESTFVLDFVNTAEDMKKSFQPFYEATILEQEKMCIRDRYNREVALDVDTLISFIKSTQPKSWEKYQVIYGVNSEKAFIDRFCKEVRQVGLLKALRQGITCLLYTSS